MAEISGPSCNRESTVNAPDIHKLGTEFIPVDESWNDCRAESNNRPVECIPTVALAWSKLLSTRLFACP